MTPLRLGFRLTTSNVVHMPWWLARGTKMQDGSACKKVPWHNDLYWAVSDADLFERDDLRGCRICIERVQRSVRNLQDMLETFIYHWG